jgi:His-Xaa-Ser system protein HxsD
MPTEVVVDFDAGIQSLSALNAAAYRLVGVAICRIDKADGRYICRLSGTGGHSSEALRDEYVQLVTDENVREALHVRTEPVRNLILSLAFGSLAAEPGDKA